MPKPVTTHQLVGFKIITNVSYPAYVEKKKFLHHFYQILTILDDLSWFILKNHQIILAKNQKGNEDRELHGIHNVGYDLETN